MRRDGVSTHSVVRGSREAEGDEASPSGGGRALARKRVFCVREGFERLSTSHIVSVNSQ